MFGRYTMLILVYAVLLWLLILPCSAATTDLHVVKYANDGTTILEENTLTYQEMESTLPVQGDGVTHYFLQGPVFLDDPDPLTEEQLRLNPDEDSNIQEKDMGAVKGTDVKDLCNLVGGMSSGDTLKIKASDGLTKEFAYKNVYSPPSRQGPLVITWYKDGKYPDSGYDEGMRLLFFADDSVNPWGEHVFGNFDWHESAESKYWYFYMNGAEKYPTTTGLSIKYVSEIQIISSTPPHGPASVIYGLGGAGAMPVAGSAAPVNPDIYGYKGKTINTFKTGILNGSVRIFSDPESKPVLANNRIRNFNLLVNLPDRSNITFARMYLFISDSHNLQTLRGNIPSFYATLNNKELIPDQLYVDTNGDDAGYVAGTYAYDVGDLFGINSTNVVSVRNLNYEQSLFTIDGVLLVTAYDDGNSPSTSYWIDEGCDVIMSEPEKGLLPDDCETKYSFPGTINMSTAGNASLYFVSTGLDQDNTTEHAVSFNGGKWFNIFNKENLSVQIPVETCLNETVNTAQIQSAIRSMDADYLINRIAILIVENHKPDIPDIVDNRTYKQEQSEAIAGDNRTPPITNASPHVQVALDTDPEGALIYFDGSYLGKTTPYMLDLRDGDSHTVRFELDGYVPSETTFVASNSTCIHASLYLPVHTTKGRLTDVPEDPDGIRYGGLYINSRPNGAMIFIDGINTGKTTPSVIMGIEPGVHSIKLVREIRDTYITENSGFVFEDQSAFILPGVLGLVDINGISCIPDFDVIVDFSRFRGRPFTVNGHTYNETIPAKVKTSQSNSFITIHENQSYISYPIPVLLEEDHYLLLKHRDYQDLSISVISDPRGAEVFIDGFRTGFTTPFTFGNISDGPHMIMVTKVGYLPQQSILDLPHRSVPISMTTVDFDLEEYPSGFLYVNSTPEGGKVSIDGLFTGEITPALFRSISTGTHSVKVTGVNASKTFPDTTISSIEMKSLVADFTSHEEN
jgi:hypothetical protein